MNRSQSLITYDGLPVSSGGAHRIRARDRHSVWNAFSQFLRIFTTCRVFDHVHLILYEDQRVEPRFFKTALERGTQWYGEPVRRLSAHIVGVEDSLGGVDTEEVFENAWTLATEDVPGALDFLGSLGPFPELSHVDSIMALGMEAKFCLCDPDTGEVLPLQGTDLYGGQEADIGLPLGLSRIYLRFATPITCSLFLSLPFSEASRELQTYIERMQATLPFKLSDKHWARWQLTAKGTRYHKRKISMPGA